MKTCYSLLCLITLALLLCLSACDTPPADPPTEAPTEAPTEVPPESSTEALTEAPTDEPAESTVTPDEAPLTEPVPEVAAGSYVVTDAEGRNGVDLIIDYPAGKDLTILQLTDTQMQTMRDVRNENRRVQISNAFFSVLPDDLEFRVFRYVDEAVEKTNPDLIVLTGDNIYGELDDYGRMWKQLIRRMDSYKIPWCVVFGNHDNESAKGVQWQVDQLLESEYCVFKQGDVSGNSNYNVLIRQGGDAKYLLYMLDSHGCTTKLHNPGESLMPDNPDIDKLVQTAGLRVDQVNWMYKSGKDIREIYGEIPSLMFMHIPPAEAAQVVHSTYGATVTQYPFVPDKEGDFGISYENIGGASGGRYWRYAKELDCIGIFVGHQHMVATSIVCEGIRLTYGLKTGTCDYHADSMLGSTKITLSETAGEMGVEYVFTELPYNP